MPAPRRPAAPPGSEPRTAPPATTGNPRPPHSRPATGPAEHASYVFLLDEQGQVHPLPHSLYVSLARADGRSASLAGRSFRLADWYVRLREGAPERVVNEWYGWVRFDAQGRFQAAPENSSPGSRPAGGGAMAPSALPTLAERARMEDLLFGRERKVEPSGSNRPEEA